MTTRSKRIEWSATSNAGPTGFLSGTLFRLGISHLGVALADREQTTFRSATNHYTEHALSCILMMAAGLEALVNALLWMEISLRDQISQLEPAECKLLEALKSDTVEQRYKRAHQQNKSIPNDCTSLLHIRDDILHAIPVMRDPKFVPQWLRSLEKRGLFLDQNELPNGPGVWLWQQKFCSYELAYWACDAVEKAVIELDAGSSGVWRQKLRHDLAIIAEHKTIFPPEKLHP